MKLTTQQEEVLRTQGHSTKLSLSIYQPPTLFSCLVNNASIARGARTIAYDNASGTYTNIYPNAIAYIGTSAGAMDIGRIRVRDATGTYLTVAENSDIDWADNQYITIKDFIEISAIYPRIIPDPADAENVIFYKDYDISYSTQNSVLGTFVCMGSHRAADLDSGSVQLYWTSSGTYNVKGDTLTYLWEFGGATSGTSTAANPGYVTYTTAGEYKTKLTITNSSGGTDISYRYVSIHDDSHPPIRKWELSNLSGSRDSGGYTATIRIYEDITVVHPNALVVLYADDWYGSNHVSLGGNQVNNSKIVFVGYILDGSIQYNYEFGYVEFQVGSPTELMKMSEGFAISAESKVTPTTWFQVAEITVSKAIFHYLKWHSTVPCVTDIRFVADNRRVQYFDSDRSSLFDAVDTFLKNGEIGNLISDRQGTLWAEINPSAIDNALSLQSVMDITKRDWMNSPNIKENRINKVSFVEMGGVVYDGAAANTSNAILSNAPGVAPAYHGKTESIEGLILTDQPQLNWLAGNYFAYQNAKYPEISLDLVGNYRNLDITPVERLTLSVDAVDTSVGIQIATGSFHITSMDWSYNSTQESFLARINLHEIAEGIYAETVTIPDIPPDDGYTYPDIPLPDFPFDPIVIPPFIFPTPVVPSFGQCVLIHDVNHGMIYTQNINSPEADVIYTVNNSGLTVAQYKAVSQMLLLPTGEVYLIVPGNNDATAGLFYATSPAGIYTQILTRQQMADLWNGSHVTDMSVFPWNWVQLGSMGYDTNSGNLLVNLTDDSGYGDGVNIIGNAASGFTLPDGVQSYWENSISYGGGAWVGTGSNRNMKFNDLGKVIANPTTLGVNFHHTRIGTGDSFYMWFRDSTSVGFYPVSGNGATIGGGITFTGAGKVVTTLATDSTGQNIMLTYGSSPGGADILKSSDTGATWSTGETYPAGTMSFPSCVFCLSGSTFIAVATGSDPMFSQIVRTVDFGATWINPYGNLATLFPNPLYNSFNLVAAIP